MNNCASDRSNREVVIRGNWKQSPRCRIPRINIEIVLACRRPGNSRPLSELYASVPAGPRIRLTPANGSGTGGGQQQEEYGEKSPAPTTEVHRHRHSRHSRGRVPKLSKYLRFFFSYLHLPLTPSYLHKARTRSFVRMLTGHRPLISPVSRVHVTLIYYVIRRK